MRDDALTENGPNAKKKKTNPKISTAPEESTRMHNPFFSFFFFVELKIRKKNNCCFTESRHATRRSVSFSFFLYFFLLRATPKCQQQKKEIIRKACRRPISVSLMVATWPLTNKRKPKQAKLQTSKPIKFELSASSIRDAWNGRPPPIRCRR